MTSFWRNLRYGILLLGFVMLGVYLFTYTPWQEWLGHKPTYAKVIAEGQPIVEAIYRFKQDRGLWPEYLDDLVPVYLPKMPAADWYYTVVPGPASEGGGPSLAMADSTAKYRTHVGFDFDPKAPSWRVFGSMEDRVLKTLRPPTAMSATMPAAEVEASALAEFDRRIKREPDLIDHWRDKISYLRRMGRGTAARAAAEEARANFPVHYWPRLALAALALESAAASASTQHSAAGTQSGPAFAAWVAAHPTYTHYYYLYVLQRLAGDNAAALASVEEMAKLPMQRAADDSGTPAYYAWDASRFALGQRRWDLVIALCDQWQAAADKDKTDELSYLALRAAALLARNKPGDADKALADLDTLAATKRSCWAGRYGGKNLEALRAAVKARDARYRFDPLPAGSDAPGEFHVFSDPQ